MSTLLFVYGSLLSRVQHPMGMRLRREAQLVGPATIEGRLYRIADYPGMVESPGRQSRVCGEVYDLSKPVTAFKWLDAYEGIVPGKPELSHYERVERPVRLASGETLTAWVYLYRKSVRGRREVPGGCWMPPSF